MKKLEKIDLGKFEVVSGKVRVTDPCYDTDVWCSGEVKKVKNGEWNSYVIKSNEGDWGKRCAVLVAYIGKPIDIADSRWDELGFEVGVDSGQAGIFDSKFYQNEKITKDWYALCCDLTLSNVGAGIIPYGCLSSSGYGDGGYDAYVIRDADKKAVAIKIDYGLIDSRDEKSGECNEMYNECAEDME